jgi:hydroxypyruvate isomerase
LTIADRLNCARINTMVGRTRGDLPREAQNACIIENLRWAAPRARDVGVTLLVEPLNTYDNPGFFLTTSREGFELLKEVEEPNVKLQFDFYHLQITEGDLTRNFLAHLAEIGHLQVADVPGRHEPGTGEINYPYVLSVIENSEYAGCVGLEYKPLGSTEESLAWLPWEARGTPARLQRQ